MRAGLLLLLILLPGLLFARPKTDVVVLENGDRLKCEIKKLERGKLTISTDAAGTISVKWSRVVGVQSAFLFQIELESGARYIGRFDQPPELGRIAVEGGQEQEMVDVARVIGMIPMEASIWSRLKGSVDAGYDFTQATTATTWSASADLDYRTPRLETSLSFDSSIKEQEGAEDVNRQNLLAQVNRYFENRWFAAVIGQGEKSATQGLDLRALVGGGVGRRFLQTNRSNILGVAGAAFSREKFEDEEDYDSNAELVFALTLETFRFDSPELDLSGSLVVLPNLLTGGRYRLQANGQARIEILNDLYWSMSVYESFDSDPPSATVRRNDFGITTSLGWSFN
ncbi:MAG TPA: DUF481 domain-containing protein [Vicinamibacteria bacterium]|nr:DUF481 domain-containing protein [Vicinamibacteria bacterium]